MVGKTNLTFISKGDSSSVQLIQKNHLTAATGQIYKMEILNNKFFAFVSSGTSESWNVLMGTNVDNLEYVTKDSECLRATHIIYVEGKYYIVNNGDECTVLYETVDFNKYEQINISEVEGKWLGIFLTSRGKTVLATYMSTTNRKDISLYMCKSPRDIVDMQVSRCSLSEGQFNESYNTCLINDKIFFPDGREISLAGQFRKPNIAWQRWNYAGGYFFKIESNTYNNQIYRTADLQSVTLYPHIVDWISYPDQAYVIPISGKYGLLYNGKNPATDNKAYISNYINIADDILTVGRSDNLIIERADKLSVTAVMEDDGKTYVGTSNGVIYELQLDYEGVIQRPDVAIIKTMAAKQALAQSLQYTDDCITKLKDYIDNKIEKKSSTVEINSTKVES